MVATIADLPTELIEIIIADFGREEIANLRLVCRGCYATASTGKFVTFFERVQLLMQPRLLQSFKKFTDVSEICGRIKHLQLVGVEGVSSQMKPLLQASFENIKRCAGKDAAMELSIAIDGHPEANDSVIERGDWRSYHEPCCPQLTRPWKTTWDLAALTANIGLSALQDSDLEVVGLDFYWNLLCCALPFDVIWPLLEQYLTSSAATKLRCLSLVVSHSLRDDTTSSKSHRMRSSSCNSLSTTSSSSSSDSDSEEDTQNSGHETSHLDERLSDITRLFDRLTNLDTFNFHWYDLYDRKLFATERIESSLFDPIARSNVWTSIKECNLVGIYTSPQAFLPVLARSKLTSLTMDGLRLAEPASLRVILDALRKANHLKHLHIANVEEALQEVHFKERGPPRSYRQRNSGYGELGQNYGCADSVTRNVKNIKKPIRYHIPKGLPVCSWETQKWKLFKPLRFGPPPRGM